ncbi:Ig-like domain-containing protein [Arabiibacter massiliensis]|uniref:Ig-like domain-containing protein n=1 Tax=Arabiibacter massiliensis TaxID=1870985 RepID=UPI00117B515D|nr:Ig-like domain-containing protein [Arabiibacter massiliensis]
MDGLTVGRQGAASGAVRSKVLRVLVAAMMALALVPAVAVDQAFAAEPTFVGSVHYPVQYDENGYPLYNEDGTFQRGNPYVTLANVENASGTLVIPASFDVVVRAEDGTETVERDVTPVSITFGGRTYVPGVGESEDSWKNAAVTSIDMSQCATVEGAYFSQLSSVESVDLSGLSNLRAASFSSCPSLRTVSTDDRSAMERFSLGMCDALSLPDFSQPQWSKLSDLSITGLYEDLTSFDASVLPELTSLTIQRSYLEQIDVSRNLKLESLSLHGNRLTELDVAKIPANVTRLYCAYNNISDTDALVERFGESNVLPQNSASRPSGLTVIPERLARGVLIPGENFSHGLADSYYPAVSESDAFYKEGWMERNAAANFKADSSDKSVATVEIVDEGNPQLRVNALKAGTTTLTIDYSFKGSFGTYAATQVVDYTVAASANPIASVSCASSADVPFVTECAIDHQSHRETGGGIMVPLDIVAQDPGRVPTQSAHVEITSADPSIVIGNFEVEPYGVDSEYAVRLNPYKVGSTTVTLTGVTYVDGQEVRTDPVTMQVNVVESATPQMRVAESFKTAYYSGGGNSVAIVGMSRDGEGPTALASYIQDEAFKNMEQWHGGNGFAVGNTVSTANGEVQVVTAVSDNEAVASVSYEHGARLDIKGPGTARVTVSDVWGNSGTCVVTIFDRAAEAQKLSLKQSELTVKVGETFDLASLVDGTENLDTWLTSGVELLVFKSANGYIAPIKYSEDGKHNVTMLLARNVGDVTVEAGMLTGNDMGGSLEYLDQWETTGFGTLTVHVVPAETPSNPATAVEVTGASDTVEMGSSLQLSAAITPADATDVGTLAWSSSDEAVATVDASGKVAPVAPGTAVITATVGSVSGTFEVTVVEKTIPATGVSISAADDAMDVGDVQQLTATVEPADSTDAVEWSSSDEKVLAVDQNGLVTAVGNGTATILARAGSAEGETGAITVTTPVTGVALDASALELYAGAQASKLGATVEPATASNKAVTWASSNEGVAMVDAEGNVAPVAAGTAAITATTADGGFSASCQVTVKQHATGIALDKHELVLTGAQTAALKATVEPDNATNKGVSWASSDEGVATVDAEGNVAAVGKGAATVTATSEDGAFSDACAVTVKNPATAVELDPSSLALVKGEAADVSAVLSGELPGEVDAVDAAAWSSSDGSVAAVADGTVTAMSSGSATVTYEAAVAGAKVVGTCAVAVTNPVRAVAISDASKSATVGDAPFTLTATVDPADADDAKVTWSSSNPAVAEVSADGEVTVHAAGSASITASACGMSAACALTVNAKEVAQTPQGSGFAASVTATDSATVERLEQLGDEGGLNLVVQAIQELTAPAREAIESLTAGGAKVAEAFDIHFAKDGGEEIVLSAGEGGAVELTVKVKLTDAMRALLDEGMALQVHYVGDDGAVEDKQTWVEDGFLCFVTDHFSDYVVTGVPPKDEGGQPAPPPAGGQQPIVPTDGGDQEKDGGSKDGGSRLAPTGDPLGAAVPAAAALACLAAAAIALVRRRMAE